MKKLLELRVFLASVLAAIACAGLRAAPVTNWHTFRAAPATTLSGQGTSSPVMGNAALPSSAAFLVGYFDAVSLTNVGDQVTLTYRVSFTDVVGMTSNDDQFRFALYDLNGQPQVADDNTASLGLAGYTDDWRGYWFGVNSSQDSTARGTIRERTGGNLHPLANAGTVLLARPTGGEVLFASSTDSTGGPTFFAEMSLEKTPFGVAVAGYFGGNGATNLFAANDTTDSWPVNYAAVGVLNGGNSSCDQVNFQDVTVTYSPSNTLHITSPPADVAVLAGQPAQFGVRWDGSGLIPVIQWRENENDIPDATNAVYTIPSTVSGQDGYLYSVVISNVFGQTVLSSGATLSIITDTHPPFVLSVSSLTSNTLSVVFSEPVDPTTAQDSGSYLLAANSFSAIALVAATNVLLTVDNPITTDYALTVQNVTDMSNNPLATTNVPGIAHGFQDALNIIISDGLSFAMNEKVVVHASGTDIFGTSDQFHYVYRPVSGDFDFQVRVESLLNTDPNAKAGLMVRQHTFFDSRNVMIEATPGRFIFQYRTDSASTSDALATPRPPTAFPNCWVRLQRVGSVISGYSDTTAGTWTFIGSLDTAASPEGAYSDEVWIGLAVTGHSATEVTQAVFSEFGQTIIAPPELSVVNLGGGIELSWPGTGFNLQATPSLTSPVWTNVPDSSVTNRMELPLGPGGLFFRLSN